MEVRDVIRHLWIIDRVNAAQAGSALVGDHKGLQRPALAQRLPGQSSNALLGPSGQGLLALVVLVFGIAQLPALIITLPAIAYLWSTGDSHTTNLIITVYLLGAGMIDNVLKPLLLGRGVEVPMPVILFGALGGMVTSGIIGLFIGAVVLAIGYQVFMDWVAEGDQADAGDEGQVQSEALPTSE